MDTADGKRAIESLRVGDWVWSKNESSGAVELKPITQTFERMAPSTLAITFSNGEIIETTAEHPLYREGDGFTPAGLLAIGNSIATRVGPSLEITGIEKKSTPATVYNFSVEEFHTYFVGSSALWVHNIHYGIPAGGQLVWDETLHGRKYIRDPNNTGREITDLDRVFVEGNVCWVVERKSAQNAVNPLTGVQTQADIDRWVANQITKKFNKIVEALRSGSSDLPSEIPNPTGLMDGSIKLGVDFHGGPLDPQFQNAVGEGILAWERANPGISIAVRW